MGACECTRSIPCLRDNEVASCLVQMRSLQAPENTVQLAVPSVDAFAYDDTLPTVPKAEHLSQLRVSTSFTSLLSSRVDAWNTG